MSSNPHPSTNRIAADLRAVAIEISQRRTFQVCHPFVLHRLTGHISRSSLELTYLAYDQDRYGSDLQAVLDSDRRPLNGRQESAKAKFVPPPAYDEPPLSPPLSPSRSYQKPLSPKQDKPLAVSDATGHLRPPLSPTSSSHTASSHGRRSGESSRSRPVSPSILTDEDPVIYLIRETLYASLADVLSTTTSLKSIMRSDPARAYFASVSLAVLDVATKAVTPGGDVKGVLGQYVTFDECPDLLKPAMRGLDAIARRAKEIAEEDDQHAMELLTEGKDEELAKTVTRMERLKTMLERGAGAEEARSPGAGGVSGTGGNEEEDDAGTNRGRVSPNGTTIELANRINALAMGLTSLAAFRERQNDVFAILGGVS